MDTSKALEVLGRVSEDIRPFIDDMPFCRIVDCFKRTLKNTQGVSLTLYVGDDIFLPACFDKGSRVRIFDCVDDGGLYPMSASVTVFEEAALLYSREYGWYWLHTKAKAKKQEGKAGAVLSLFSKIISAHSNECKSFFKPFGSVACFEKRVRRALYKWIDEADGGREHRTQRIAPLKLSLWNSMSEEEREKATAGL